MPRLTRVHQKVFASNASNNGVFGSLQAGNPQTSNDVATLQSLSAFENGWDDAIEQGDKLPPLEEFQGIQYGISYQQAYMLQEGIAEWNASTTYYKGSLVKTISGSSFKLYCSLADNNTNHVVTNTTYWKLVMDSDNLYAYDSDVVHKTGNESIGGTKTFSDTITGSITGNAGTVTNGVYTNTAQTISGNKTFSGTNTFSGVTTIKQPYISKSDSNLNGGTIVFLGADNEPNASKSVYISRYNGRINFGGYKSDGTQVDPFAVDIQNNQASVGNDMAVAGAAYLNGNVYCRAGLSSTSSSSSDTKTNFFGAYNLRYTYGTAPSTNIDTQITFFDSTNSWTGLLQHHYYSVGGSAVEMTCRKPDKSSTCYFGVGWSSSGNSYAYGSTDVKKSIAGWSIPDYTTASETNLGNITSGHRYTATMDGTLHVQAQGTYVEVHISLVRTNDTLELVGAKDGESGVGQKTIWIPVKAGQTYEITGRGSERFYAFFCALTAGS